MLEIVAEVILLLVEFVAGLVKLVLKIVRIFAGKPDKPEASGPPEPSEH